jgi:Ca-activated chloride channel family protein
VSGSMSSQFEQYYYDEHGNRREVGSDSDENSKMAAARKALSSLTEQLRDEDQLGVVLYSSGAHVAKPLRPVGETNMDAIRDHIKHISAGGGTDMSAGYSAAMDLLEPHHGADLAEVENRVVFMTDAMPNLGTTDRDDIVDEFDAAADKHVHTTFVGIGLDTNADLVESISGVRGANHYFVHSTEEFTQRLADEFTYMVTPLVFDLSLDVVSDGYEIEAVYGSPNADQATGEVMHVTTLFPSPTSEGETRGGVTLLQLRETGPNASLELVANWMERDGTADRDVATIDVPTVSPEHFDNTGIRKAVVLSRYGRLLREWMSAVRDDTGDLEADSVDDWVHPDERELGEWEDQSVPLAVPSSYQDEFEALRQYVTSEQEIIGDDDVTQEVEILKLLSDSDARANTRNSETTEPNSHPDNCPNCGEDITGYGPGSHLCPHCGIEIS